MCNRLRRSRWLGLLFAAHFKAGHARRLFSGICTQDCYSAHIFSLPMCPDLSQYRRFLFSIGSCYCLHIFSVYRRFPRVSTTADKENAGLLSTAQFARWVKFGYCYRQHISEFRLLSKRVRTGLLSSAHFRQWGCYRAHSFQTVEFWRLLLSTAHF